MPPTLSNTTSFWFLITQIYNFSKKLSLKTIQSTKRTEISSIWKSNYRIKNQLEMWANAQRDGHPAKYRWHPLFNAGRFD